MAVSGALRLKTLKKRLRRYGSDKKAAVLQRFFKTAPGEYAEGDVFLGVGVPILRMLARQYRDLKLEDVVKLLKSDIHEERLLSLLVLIMKYRKTGPEGKKEIYEIYLDNTAHINNWDLVDVTAKHIVGDYLSGKDRRKLYELARSGSLWERRISVLSTFHFIENGDYEDTFKIARMLLCDEHDLIHKAVGWMLREIGKRDIVAEEDFLDKHHKTMPRTMLRYAIEKFSRIKRMRYLNA